MIAGSQRSRALNVQARRNNTLKRQASIISFLIAILLSAIPVAIAQQTATKPARTVIQSPTAEQIVNLDALKSKVRQYHDCTCKCGCYSRDIDAQADRAIRFLRKRAEHRRVSEKLAMVLDIDETSLSNYQELDTSGFNYVERDFNAWVDTAQAPAIAGTLRLYKEAQKLGVSIFFITGRPETQRAVTERNLTEQGYANWQKLILRPASMATESTTVFKSAMRAQIVGEGYKLVVNVGDQWSDLNGEPHAEFSVKYPDPFYLIP
jgi:acid phosphatase